MPVFRRIPKSVHTTMCAVFVMILFLPEGRFPTVSAQPVKTKPRVDAYGDPLPARALARLGTLRLVHPDRISSVAVSPDGKMVASAGGAIESPEIRLWQTRTGQLLRIMKPATNSVHCLRFSPDGKTLVAGCNLQLCGWEVPSGKRLFAKKTTTNLSGWIKSIQFTPGKDKLITIHHDNLQNVIRVWDRVPLKCLWQWPKAGKKAEVAEDENHWSFSDSTVITKDAHWIARSWVAAKWMIKKIGGGKSIKTQVQKISLQIINARSGQVTYEIPGFPERIRQLAFSPEGRKLAAASEHKLWFVDVRAGKKLIEAEDSPGDDWWIQFTPDGKRLVANLSSPQYFWDVATGKKITQTGFRADSGIDFSADGRIMVAGRHNAVRLWDCTAGKEICVFPGHRECADISFTRDGHVLSEGFDHTILWRPPLWKPKKLTRSKYLQNFTWVQKLNRLVLSRGHKRVVQVGKKNEVEIRHFDTGQLIHRFPAETTRIYASTFCLLSPNGHSLSVAWHDHKQFHVRFFDLKKGQRLGKLSMDMHRFNVNWGTCAFSPDGKIFVCQLNDGRLPAVDIRTGQIVRYYGGKAKRGVRERVAPHLRRFSKDGRYLVAVPNGAYYIGGTTTTFRVWETARGREVRRIVLRGTNRFDVPSVWKFVISPDNRMIACIRRDDNMIHIYEIASGKERLQLSGHKGSICDLAFSPCGRILASSGYDTTILLWRIRPPVSLSGVDK